MGGLPVGMVWGGVWYRGSETACTDAQETETLEIRIQGGEGVALVPGFGAAIVKAEADVAPAACF